MSQVAGRNLTFMEKNKIITVLIIILAFIALVLGYAIYRERFASFDKKSVSGTQFAQTQDFQAPQSQGPALYSGDDERAVLNAPSPDAPEEERQAHFELAKSVAQDAEYLDITGCVGSPLVLKVKGNEPISVRNDDAVEHSIGFNNALYPISAGGTTEVAFDFHSGPGLYGYGCDTSQGAAGMFLVGP